MFKSQVIDEQEQPWKDARRRGNERLVRWAVGIACLSIAAYLAYRIRWTLAPIGTAFLLSYAVEPPVTFLKTRCRIPRGVSAGLCLVMAVVACSVFWVWAGPRFADQINELAEKLPDYSRVVAERFGMSMDEVDQMLGSFQRGESEGVDKALQLGDLAIAVSRRLFGIVGTVTLATIYTLLALLLVAVFFFLFVTYRGWHKRLEVIIPRAQRPDVRKVLGYMDRALGAYVRGQLLVALFTFTGFSIGFYLVDVPYWFVVALIGGVLSLIPYGQVTGLVGAITLKFLESQTGDVSFSFWGIVLAPALVYAVTQSMESWVITPLVQGEVNKLHPALVFTVLILGGALAGVVGLILAIPVTATAKASLQTFLLDRHGDSGGEELSSAG